MSAPPPLPGRPQHNYNSSGGPPMLPTRVYSAVPNPGYSDPHHQQETGWHPEQTYQPPYGQQSSPYYQPPLPASHSPNTYIPHPQAYPSQQGPPPAIPRRDYFAPQSNSAHVTNNYHQQLYTPTTSAPPPSLPARGAPVSTAGPPALPPQTNRPSQTIPPQQYHAPAQPASMPPQPSLPPRPDTHQQQPSLAPPKIPVRSHSGGQINSTIYNGPHSDTYTTPAHLIPKQPLPVRQGSAPPMNHPLAAPKRGPVMNQPAPGVVAAPPVVRPKAVVTVQAPAVDQGPVFAPETKLSKKVAVVPPPRQTANGLSAPEIRPRASSFSDPPAAPLATSEPPPVSARLPPPERASIRSTSPAKSYGGADYFDAMKNKKQEEARTNPKQNFNTMVRDELGGPVMGSYSAAIESANKQPEHIDSRKFIMMYKINVEKNGLRWIIYRRFNQFHELDRKLKKYGLVPKTNSTMPPKDALATKDDASLVAARVVMLGEFLQMCLASPAIQESAYLYTFIEPVQLGDVRPGQM